MSSETIGAAGLAGRYAVALYELAEADKLLDQVAGDLHRFLAMIKASDDLFRLIRSPTLSRQDQMRAVVELANRAKMNDLTRRFVGVVALNRRLYVLPSMITAYHNLLAKRRGEATAKVVSAKKLTEQQLKTLAASLKKALGTEVAVDARVDAGLLGGLMVKVGSRMVDSSLRTKLQQLRFTLKGVG